MRYSWYGQMPPGQTLPGQISPLQLESVQNGSRNLPLKFGQNGFSNNWDITDIEFPVEVPEIIWWGSRDYMVCKVIFASNPTKVMLGCIEVELGFWQ